MAEPILYKRLDPDQELSADDIKRIVQRAQNSRDNAVTYLLREVLRAANPFSVPDEIDYFPANSAVSRNFDS